MFLIFLCYVAGIFLVTVLSESRKGFFFTCFFKHAVSGKRNISLYKFQWHVPAGKQGGTPYVSGCKKKKTVGPHTGQQSKTNTPQVISATQKIRPNESDIMYTCYT